MINVNIQQLYNIANKPTRRIIGLMSGTSMDGLDVALCEVSGAGLSTSIKLLAFDTIDYTPEIKHEIRKVFAKKNIDFQQLVLLNEWIGILHGQMVLACLEKWQVASNTVDIVASHGQTVFHAPQHQHGMEGFPDATLQIGDGDHVAVTTGIITLADFRQKHLAAGGEGAPLAVYGDYFIFSSATENRIMLNMGGIANFTFLPKGGNASEVFVTDTGPGNTLLDAAIRQYYPHKNYDTNGEIALSGTVHEGLLATLKQVDFFQATFPKTTGPEVFNMDYVAEAQQKSGTLGLAPTDLMATLTQLSVDTIAEALNQTMQPNESYVVYMSGGGMHNPALTGGLVGALPHVVFKPSNELGIKGDAKEAVLFAILANEALCGGTTNFGNRAKTPSVSMGKVSFPV